MTKVLNLILSPLYVSGLVSPAVSDSTTGVKMNGEKRAFIGGASRAQRAWAQSAVRQKQVACSPAPTGRKSEAPPLW